MVASTHGAAKVSDHDKKICFIRISSDLILVQNEFITLCILRQMFDSNMFSTLQKEKYGSLNTNT